MIWRIFFGRTSILGGWWWTRWSPIFLEHPFCLFFYSSFSSNHPIVLNLYSSEKWNCMNSVPQTAATTFAFSSVCFFFYMWGEPSLVIPNAGGPKEMLFCAKYAFHEVCVCAESRKCQLDSIREHLLRNFLPPVSADQYWCIQTYTFTYVQCWNNRWEVF